jgi:hypothetical protein
MFRTGYILGGRADLFWFLGLPFIGIALALVSQQWLPAVALASANLWITVPHHFATWMRTYGLSDDFARFRDQLIVGPILLLLMALAGLAWAPLTVAMVVILWDHQHSIMQQHGFARIYDFKAGTGAPSTRQFDLGLNCMLYINLLLTAPLFATLWIRWIYRWGFQVSPATVHAVQTASWVVTAVFLVIYTAHVSWCVWHGHPVNPIKYLFIGASFFLWYFTAWQSASWLVHGIAHRVMHGLQYIVIVYWYARRKLERTAQPDHWWARVFRPGHVAAFAGLCILYAGAFQLITRQPLDAFGLGIVNFVDGSQGIPEHGLGGIDYRGGYDLFATALISTAGLTHYYFDSFIWKVRDRQTQEGL